MEGETLCIIAAVIIVLIMWKFCKRVYPHTYHNQSTSSTGYINKLYPDLEYLKDTAGMVPIIDRFSNLNQVQDALRKSGLESCNLIFGIDFTHSNTWQGKMTFHGRCLHDIEGEDPNPYQQVISTIGKTLETFDEDGIIPAFGFGDASTKDRSVFPFKTQGYCHGFEDVLSCYNQIHSQVVLSGPTSFAPLIYEAINIVRITKAYHILVIVADGQVTSELPTIDAIVKASEFPLSIIMVGVGDGPWTQMKEFDDRLPARRFDNFQFVDFNAASKAGKNMEMSFALHALMEIPDQFLKIRQLGLLNM